MLILSFLIVVPDAGERKEAKRPKNALNCGTY
jgi:hypothetical protein